MPKNKPDTNFDNIPKEHKIPVLGKKCAGCGKPTVHEYRPFCSKRCSTLDLGKWLKEDYRVHTDEFPDADFD